jgi:hypothetical protein
MGMLLACAVALQATGALPLIASAAAASCCCHHDKTRPCQCRTCTHAREMETDHRFIQTCAGPSDPVIVVVQVAPALPQSGLPAALDVVPPFLASATPFRVPPPDREVPTPPPLSRRS